MRKTGFMAVAALAVLLIAGGCAKKDTAATDTAGTAAMTDTTAGAATMGSPPGTTPSPTMSDTAAAGTMGTATGTDTTKGRASGDTTTKK
jgi:hypothetical protein